MAALARSTQSMDLVCPAGTLPALRAAVDNGADWVYFALHGATHPHGNGGYALSEAEVAAGMRHAHEQGARVLLAADVYPETHSIDDAKRAIDTGASLGADAIELADPGLMRYAARTHPGLPLHLSVRAAATSYHALNFYREQFGVKRAVLPRVLALEQVEHIVANTDVEIEVFGFGTPCIMVEGRCALSSYVAGVSRNTSGVCSPVSAVEWVHAADKLECRLNGMLVDRYYECEKASYPTPCKGRYDVAGQTYYALEEPAGLSAVELRATLARIGVAAIRIEGARRNIAYLSQVTRLWRKAIDGTLTGTPDAQALHELAGPAEQSLGAYSRPWK